MGSNSWGLELWVSFRAVNTSSPSVLRNPISSTSLVWNIYTKSDSPKDLSQCETKDRAKIGERTMNRVHKSNIRDFLLARELLSAGILQCCNWAPSSLEPVHLNLQNKISNVQVKEIVRCCECERDGKRRLECKKETSSRFKYEMQVGGVSMEFFFHFCFKIVGRSAIRIFVIRKFSRLEATTSCSVFKAGDESSASAHILTQVIIFCNTRIFYWLNKQSLVSVSVCWELHIFSRSLVLILSRRRLATTTWWWTATSSSE